MSFTLDPRLESSSIKIQDSELSEIRLNNNKNYLWIILIPRVEKHITELFELTSAQQSIVMTEITRISHLIKKNFRCDKINVGALGNIVSQLHIHLIARYQQDLHWPHSVWQKNISDNHYSNDEQKKLLVQLRELFK